MSSLRVRQVATGSDVEVLPARDAVLESPAFSPDGNYLFYLTRKPENPNYRALFQIPSLGGAPARARLRRRLARQLLARRQAGRLLARACRRSGSPSSSSSTSRPLAGARCWPRSAEPEVLPGGGRLVSRRRDDRRAAAEPGARPRDHGRFLRRPSRRAAGLPSLPRTILTSLAWLPDGRGLVASGQDLRTAVNDQVFLISHPEARLQRVTNDFNRYLGRLGLGRRRDDRRACASRGSPTSGWSTPPRDPRGS